VAGRTGRTVSRRAPVLCRPDFFDPARHRHGFSQHQSSQSALLDGDYQWRTRAPFLLVGILIAASDRKLMENQPSSWLSRIAVGIITLAMFGAATAMFLL
jgi:peptidoglycan/LPS O-acetylase OafA/YrhL